MEYNYIDKKAKTCIMKSVDASKQTQHIKEGNALQKGGISVSLFRKKLAYEFVPTKDKKILEVDTLLKG